MIFPVHRYSVYDGILEASLDADCFKLWSRNSGLKNITELTVYLPFS